MSKEKWYSLKNILKHDALYSMVYGERGPGKTYAWKVLVIEEYFKNKKQSALIRRYDEDFKGNRGSQLFDDINLNQEVHRITKGKWDYVEYYSRKWYFGRYEENDKGEKKKVRADEPFLFGFGLSSAEHDKSISYSNVKWIILEEFISMTGTYLTDEFVLFQNTLSTIIRHRTDVRILMFANAISKYCPYFAEMGLSKGIKKQLPGTIDIYKYGESGLSVAVEYTEAHPARESNKYFAFGNEKLKMISDGSWQIPSYPHLPQEYRFRPKDVRANVFFNYDDEWMHGEVVQKNGSMFLMIHAKTTPLFCPEKDWVYSSQVSPLPNWRRRVTRPVYAIDKLVLNLIKQEKVYYGTNECGDLMENYLKWCERGA